MFYCDEDYCNEIMDSLKGYRVLSNENRNQFLYYRRFHDVYSKKNNMKQKCIRQCQIDIYSTNDV